jgi:O-antigen/teichoic acid export membrane protein
MININKYLDFSDKVKGDIVWSILGFLVIGLSGIGLTFLTARFYSTAALGLLNTVLIIYTIYSQIANFGIHFAVIKYVSEYQTNSEVLSSILRSSLLATFVISSVFTIIFYFLIDTISGFFLIENLKYALNIICPSIVLFTLNKVLLSYYNGIRSIKSYSIFFAFRFLSWIILLLIFVLNDVPGEKLSYIFLVSEAVLFLILLISVIRVITRKSVSGQMNWFSKVISFGMKSVLGSIFADFNTRIDVLILGMFQSGSVVGIYSFATMFIDGFSQLGIVFRINMNPILTNTYFNSGKDKLKEKIVKVRNILYVVLFGVISFTLIIYPVIIKVAGLNPEYELSFIPLLILSAGLVLSSGYLPFQMIFNQTGFPMYQTMFYLIVFLVNVILNLTLVPLYGILGCAIATSISYISVPFIINLLNKKSIGFAF